MTSSDFYSNAEYSIEAMGRDLEGLTYKGTPVFYFLKIATYLQMKNRYVNGTRNRFAFWRASLWGIVRQLWSPDYTTPQRFVSNMADFIVALDHDHPNLNILMLRLVSALGEPRVFILTENRRIAAEVSGGFAGPCYTPSLERTMKVTLEHLQVLKAVYRATPFFRQEGWGFTLLCFIDLLVAMKLHDFFLTHLDPARCQAVLTLMDIHPSELALTAAARAKGIPTFTLQHGVAEIMHTPVHSDRIFVWGEATKQDLLRLGVPAEKIVISGRPLLDEAAANYRAQAPSLRASFRVRHPRGNSSGPVITYIAGNVGKMEEHALLSAFAASWSLEISPVVRLKPTIDKELEQCFQDWISELGGASEVYVSMNDDLYELLAVSDVVIGFQSSVVVEAMAFGGIPVLLDILPEYHLQVINPHYQDCLIVRNADELRQLIKRMTEDAEYFQQLQEVSATTATRYFGGKPGVPATRFIRDYIVNFASPEE